jgi:hypothetical protein
MGSHPLKTAEGGAASLWNYVERNQGRGSATGPQRLKPLSKVNFIAALKALRHPKSDRYRRSSENASLKPKSGSLTGAGQALNWRPALMDYDERHRKIDSEEI